VSDPYVVNSSAIARDYEAKSRSYAMWKVGAGYFFTCGNCRLKVSHHDHYKAFLPPGFTLSSFYWLLFVTGLAWVSRSETWRT